MEGTGQGGSWSEVLWSHIHGLCVEFLGIHVTNGAVLGTRSSVSFYSFKNLQEKKERKERKASG